MTFFALFLSEYENKSKYDRKNVRNKNVKRSKKNTFKRGINEIILSYAHITTHLDVMIMTSIIMTKS